VGGTTPRAVIEKSKAMRRLDVKPPATHGRELTLSRYAQAEAGHRILTAEGTTARVSLLPLFEWVVAASR
jgi:hypothetical protein